MVLSYMVVVLPPSVVVQNISPPLEVALGGICDFVAPLC